MPRLLLPRLSSLALSCPLFWLEAGLFKVNFLMFLEDISVLLFLIAFRA